MVTEEALRKALESIGWSIGTTPLNTFIKNDKGGRTNLMVRNNSIGLHFENSGCYGKEGLGSMEVSLNDIEIESDKISVTLKFGNESFFSFYNFDNVY